MRNNSATYAPGDDASEWDQLPPELPPQRRSGPWVPRTKGVIEVHRNTDWMSEFPEEHRLLEVIPRAAMPPMPPAPPVSPALPMTRAVAFRQMAINAVFQAAPKIERRIAPLAGVVLAIAIAVAAFQVIVAVRWMWGLRPASSPVLELGTSGPSQPTEAPAAATVPSPRATPTVSGRKPPVIPPTKAATRQPVISKPTAPPTVNRNPSTPARPPAPPETRGTTANQNVDSAGPESSSPLLNATVAPAVVPLAASAPPPVAPPVTAATPTDTASPPAAAVSAADTSAIHRVLDRYRNAFWSLRVDGISSFWPSANTKALSRAFDELDAQRFDFDGCRIDVRGASASALCSGTAHFVPKVGNKTPRAEPRSWTFQLTRKGDGWIIEKVESR